MAGKPYTERMDRRSFLKRAYELFLLAMLLIAALFAVPFLLPILFTAISACLLNYLSDSNFSAPRRGVVMLQ
jgi:predicted PurR-regulated permease PerM